ncbi:MAG TPA: hypothetical protein VLU43_00045 [Anaeromyxobacteraceae bacterium]|nr:hypothetical protein [Anaeromyxobacteraceae bacterium]
MTRTKPRGELSARILAPLFRYVAERRGEAVLAESLARAGAPARARSRLAWLTHAEFEASLAAVRACVADEAEFLVACGHDLGRSYGAFALVARAFSVALVYRILARTLHVFSRVSAFEYADLGGSRVWLRYTSPLRESRLMCLSRIAQLSLAPTVSGLPAATVEERQCIGRGDPCCEYVIRW